jgi:hypothetical protein
LIKKIAKGINNIEISSVDSAERVAANGDPTQMSISFSKKKGPEGPFSILANF